MRRAIVVALVVGLVVGLVGPGCKGKSAKKAPVEDAALIAGWRSDVALVVSELVAHHPQPFHKTSEADFRAAAAALDESIPTMSFDQRVIGLAKLLALIGEGHTNLSPNMAFVLAVPLRFYWFPEGLFVIGASDEHRAAVGARVVSVAGHPIDEVTATLSTTFGWDSDGFRRQYVAFLLGVAVALRGTGIAPAEGPIKVGLVDASGAARDLAIEPIPWRGPKAEANPPLHRKQPSAFYWHEYLAAERTLYVHYKQCKEDPKLPFADFTTQVTAILDSQPIERLVIDLRYNGGGNSEVIRPLLAAIQARPALRGRLFTIIGRATFSSGIYAAVELDRAGALLVGEPAGAAASHFGEIRRVALPGTKLQFAHSTKWHELPGYPDTALPPEVLAEESSADFFAGKDPAMAAVLARPVPFP